MRASSPGSITRTLTTQGTPGSVLVPVIQADTWIEYLALGGVLRASGARIWPLTGIQRMTVPQAVAPPSWLWTAQGAAEHEDQTMLASSTVSGGPKSIVATSSISTLTVGGSANGGNLAFSDIVAMLAKAAAVKLRPPLAFYCSPRTFWSHIVSMVDLSSRPIFIPTYAKVCRSRSKRRRRGQSAARHDRELTMPMVFVYIGIAVALGALVLLVVEVPWRRR